jgi:hypothetical protein
LDSHRPFICSALVYYIPVVRDVSSHEAVLFFLPFTTVMYLLSLWGLETKYYVAGKKGSF